MTDQEKIKSFAELFNSLVDKSSIDNNGDTFLFSLVENVSDALIEEVIGRIFDVHKLINKYQINIRRPLIQNLTVFENKRDFINGYSKYNEDFDNLFILILSFGESYLIKNKNEQFSQEKSFIFNYYSYRKLILFLSENPIFTTLNNKSDNKLIILSKDRGPYTIGYLNNESRLEEFDDLALPLSNLKELFLKKEFIQFFKETIVNSGIHSYEEKNRFYEIIKHLTPFISLSEKDYENYILDFSFDKLKAKFKEERNKYFESLEKNIESVNKQVASLPLTFAATIFASYQVKDKPGILFLIFVAYLLYTIIAFVILNISSYNIKCLKEDVIKEEDEVKKSYVKTYDDFKNDFLKIYKKITKIKRLIMCLQSILILIIIIFLGYCIYQVSSKTDMVKGSITIPYENIKSISLDTIPNQNNDIDSNFTSNKNSSAIINSSDSSSKVLKPNSVDDIHQKKNLINKTKLDSVRK